MAKKQKVKSIQMSTSVREKVAQMVAQLNLYLQAVRDTLNVPEGWVMVNDQRGVPTSFAPPKEKPE